jgi:hypothetical protein
MHEETFAEKDARFLTYATGWAHEASLLNATVDLSTISDAEIPVERAKQARWREAKFNEWIFLKTFDILNWAIEVSPGLISTPIMTFEEFAVKAKTATPQTLRGDVEMIDLNMERIQEAIKFMRREFELDKDLDEFRMEKWKRDEGFTVGSKMHSNGFRVEFSLEAFTKLRKEIQEKIAVLVEATAWHEKVKKIYVTELSQRGKDEPAEVARITAELSRVMKDAEIQKKIVVKAARDCKRSDLKDAVAAQTFVVAKRRFHELSGEHHSLVKQLATVNVSGRKLGGITDFPLKPNAGSIDERNDWQRIESLASVSGSGFLKKVTE